MTGTSRGILNQIMHLHRVAVGALGDRPEQQKQTMRHTADYWRVASHGIVSRVATTAATHTLQYLQDS
jgi:hypothetical protein